MIPGRVSPSVLSAPRLLLNYFSTQEYIYKTIPPPDVQTVPLGGWDHVLLTF